MGVADEEGSNKYVKSEKTIAPIDIDIDNDSNDSFALSVSWFTPKR